MRSIRGPLFFVLLLFILVSLPTFAQEKTVRVAAGEWPPFISQDLPDKGFVAKIVETAFARAGYKVEWGFFPWKRSYDLAVDGVWDATVPWIGSAERAQYFLASSPLFTSTEALLFAKTGLIQWRDLSELKGLRIGAALGYFYGEDFEKAEKSDWFRVERTDDETNLKKLIAGRLDAVAINPVVAWDLLRRIGVRNAHDLFVFADRKLKSAGSSLLVSKQSPRSGELFAAFEKAIAEMTRNGSLYAFYEAEIMR